MASFNKVILAGNLTRDPQLSYLPSNTPVCEFGLAMNRKWKSQSGEMREEVCYVDIQAYGKQAEVLNQYVNKGKPLLVEGRLHFRSWEGKDGQKRSKLSVVVENFQFIGAPPGDGSRGPRASVSTRAPEPIRAGGGGMPGDGGGGYDETPPIEEPSGGGEHIPF